MSEPIQNLGRLQAVYGTAPAYLQRAAITAVLAFVFFLAMLILFSVQQNVSYFLLATAFLIVQIFTLFGWITQTRRRLEIYENGFVYGKKNCRWTEIAALAVETDKRGQTSCEITKKNGEKIRFSEVVHNLPDAVARVEKEYARTARQQPKIGSNH
jgi:hypothetical protein